MSPQERPNLATLACKYLKYLSLQRTAREHTIKAYANDLGQFLAPLGVQKILYASSTPVSSFQTITKENQATLGPWDEKTIKELIHKSQMLWAPLKPASRNRKTASVRGFLRWLCDEKWIDSALELRLHNARLPQRIVNFLSVDEALSLLKALHDPVVRALVLLLYGAGLRVSEACQLKRKNLVESGRSLRVLGKGGRERMVALPESAWIALTALPDHGEFVLGGEAPLHPRTAYEMVRQAGLQAGLLRPLHPHALRHSYATHMLSSGADLRVLQELLGHRSLAATQKYTHLSIDQLARTLEKHHPLSGSGASKLKKQNDLD